MSSQTTCILSSILSTTEQYRKLMVSVECASLPLSHRKHGPDCGPCFLPGGLHSPDTRPQPPKLQGLCPSCPKGQFSYKTPLSFLSSAHLFFFDNICLLFVQIPYLGFCACEELGETGVWQLVDPPILPLTHGPNHSFNWREMLMQDWRICCLALYLLAALNCWKIFIFNPLCYKSSPTTKKKTCLASIKDIMQKKIAFIIANVFRCTAQEWENAVCVELQIGFAFPSTLHFFFARNVEVLREMWVFLDGCWWIRFYATRRCQLRLCVLLPSHTHCDKN